ncbi:MAG: hypothetical protein Q7S52_05200 [bacterium]|nr:hypothetical protein [bacterium]
MRPSHPWRLLVAMMLLPFTPLLYGEEVPSRPSPQTTLERIAQADAICKSETLEPTTKIARGRSVIAERPVILCAYKESDASWHVIKLLVQYPLPDCFRKTRPVDRHLQCGAYPFRTITPEYGVEYVSGLGIPRLTFAVSHQGERLKIYRYRHIWFADHLPQNAPAMQMIASSTWIEYTPYAKDFHDDEHVKAGTRFLYEKVIAALADLRTAGVQSRAYPRLLADVISWRHLMILALIEQMDHDLFNGFGVCLSPDEQGLDDREVERRIVCKEESAQKTTEAVLVEYALNRERAFYFSRSNFPFQGRIEHAYGAMQFTNHSGTYSDVVRQCDAARLIVEFPEGALHLGNAIKAATCLLDKELAVLPVSARDLFAANPKVGGIYPVAAYNEGGGGARELLRRIEASGIDLASLPDEAFELPQKVFNRSRGCNPCGRRGNSRLRTVWNEETYMYIKKYLYVWKFLEELNLDAPDVSR